MLPTFNGMLREFCRNQKGASTIEVTLIAALTVVVSVSSIAFVGESANQSIQSVGYAMCETDAEMRGRLGGARKNNKTLRSCKVRKKTKK